MIIASNSRGLVVGKTGSGKTEYGKRALWPAFTGRKVFHDVKCENNNVVHDAIARTPKELTDLLYQQPQKKAILYQPLDISPSDFNQVCKICFLVGNITLFVDEASVICSPSSIEQWHFEIIIRGRSRGVGIWDFTQRPRAIHNSLISEAEHFFVFRLNMKTDREKMAESLGDEILNAGKLKPYHCIYANLNEEFKYLKPLVI